MAALVNPYFKKAVQTEQNLFEQIKTESIKIMGREYLYLPRNIADIDQILGEDTTSKFEHAIPIEMFMEEVQGFTGDNELYGKFGLEIASSYTLVVSRSRWETEVVKPAYSYMRVKNRPQEGDLIYDLMTKFLMEIKFVDHDADFYQLSKNYVYKLSCEAFQYDSEELNTGIEGIDSIEELNSNNILDARIKQESGFIILLENGGSLILDEQPLPDFLSGKDGYDKTEDFDSESVAIDWSVSNPFTG